MSIAMQKSYIKIKEYLKGFVEMEQIVKALDADEVKNNNSYKIYFETNNDFWIATISITTKFFRHNYSTLLYKFFFSREKEQVFLKAYIKSTSDLCLNNLLFEKLFIQLHKKGIHKIQMINEEMDEIGKFNLSPMSYRFSFLKVKFIMGDIDNLIKQVDCTLNLINSYNNSGFDKLYNKYKNKNFY